MYLSEVGVTLRSNLSCVHEISLISLIKSDEVIMIDSDKVKFLFGFDTEGMEDVDKFHNREARLELVCT